MSPRKHSQPWDEVVRAGQSRWSRVMLVSACRGVGNHGGGVQRHLEEHWARGGHTVGFWGASLPPLLHLGSQGCAAHPCIHSVLLSPGDCQSAGQTQAMAGSGRPRPTGRGKTDPLGAPVEWEPPNPCMAGQRDGRRQVLSSGNHLDLPSSSGCWTLISLLLQV